MLFKEFLIYKDGLESIKGDSIEEKLYNYFINGENYIHLKDKEWDFYEIKETTTEENKEAYYVILKIKDGDDTQNIIAGDNNSLETSSQEDELPENNNCKKDCCGSCCKSKEVNNSELDQENFSKSLAYEGPWSDKAFKMDIAQMAAFFEVVQFMEYMVRKTEIATPVAMRSAQECQRFIVENLCDVDQEQIMNHTNKEEPIKIKLKDEFVEHLKKWQEESIKLFEERVVQMKNKPEIVKATMMPKDGFNPKGPGA